jgi:adenylate cyclase
MKKNLHIIVPLASVLLCSFLLLTTLDNKIFDLFLRTIPSLTENDSVLLVTIDNPSIENVGLFPWPRDVMADAIVYLSELDAHSVLFDLSYLDKSPVVVDPEYVKTDLPKALDFGFSQIDTAVSQTMDAFANHQIGARDAGEYKAQILGISKDVKNSLDTSISYVSRDLDAYFAKTLKFFGRSYLTLTMIKRQDIAGKDKTYDMSGVDVEWLESHVALDNVVAKHDTLTPNDPGIDPAIPVLLRSAYGAGTVNAEPDADGYRRRVHLLSKYNGKYYGQLSFVALCEWLGNPAIEVTNQAIVLKGAKLNGVTRDIKIPRAQDGSVLIKWPKKQFVEYKSISAWDLIGAKRLETDIVKNLQAMRDSGFLNYWSTDSDGANPYDAWSQAEYIKNEILDKGESQDVTVKAYRAARLEFLQKMQKFLDPGYEGRVIADCSDDATREYVRTTFASVRKDFDRLQAMRNRVAGKVANALCIIGVDATSMTDVDLITFQERFPNVGTYATVANMILSDEFLDDTPPAISILIALILSIAVGLGIKHLDTKKSLFAGLAVLAVSVLSLMAFFMITKRYVGVIVPFASVSATFISLSAITFLTTIREKSFLRSAFSRYLSPAVINEIIADPSKLNLGGEKREMTAIFTDIRGFSTISEQLDPADLVNLLNLYLTGMSNIVLEHRGTIDKYEGDAIIAFFGAPIYMEEHAALACRTAIRMKAAEAELNKRIAAENLSPSPLFTRIGINTGDMIVGNMGTPNKMDYTVMGNAVNLAARLEGVNKQYNTRGILISEHTRDKIGDEFLLRRLDRVRVVGVNTPLRLYELLGVASESPDAARELVALWETALDAYEARDFAGAGKKFAEVASRDPEDQVAVLYQERCAELAKNPPAEWDPIRNLTQK